MSMYVGSKVEVTLKHPSNTTFTGTVQEVVAGQHLSLQDGKHSTTRYCRSQTSPMLIAYQSTFQQPAQDGSIGWYRGVPWPI